MRAVAFALLLLVMPFSAVQAQGLLDEAFRNPPSSARPHTWWHWANGNVTKQGITLDLEAMKRVGIGGAQIFNVDVGIPSGKTPFMSRQWREAVAHAIREANRLGLEICIHNCAGWSSSGGPWIKPEHAMQVLVWSVTKVEGPRTFEGSLPRPETRLGYYRDIAVLAFPMPAADRGKPAPEERIPNYRAKAAFDRADRLPPQIGPTEPGTAIASTSILNLTDRLSGDRLVWQAPEGEWVLLRIGHTPTGKENHPAPPEGRGLECDKLSREAMDVHWAGMMATVLKDIGPLAGKTLNNALIDSYEVGYCNWTPRFREEFRRRRGYDLLRYLPAVTGRIVDSLEISERFLWDFRRTVADLFADNYFGYFAELCRRNGMLFSVEGYGNGAFDNLQVGGLADIPMGEFWVGGAAMETARLAASAAHTNGRRVVGAEAFTADWNRGRWLVEPYGIKALGDYAFTQGINRYIFHRYAHQPWTNLVPGMTMGPWGMHFERTTTWWDPGAEWLRYVARCQHLLQSGRFVADVLYFMGESGPSDLLPRQALRPEVPIGYDYDGCDATVLLKRATVRNGRIVLPDGMSYRVLVLPDTPFMTPALASKIAQLVRDGATVIGPRPRQAPGLTNYPDCDSQVAVIGKEVWGECDGETITDHRYGKGRVVWGRSLASVLREMLLPPDFEVRGPGDQRIEYIHRAIQGGDFYFVSNQRYRTVEFEAAFRAAGRAPELWHPDTGRIEPVAAYRVEGGRTFLTLRLDPAGSVWVVFRKPARGPAYVHAGPLGAARAGRRPAIEVLSARYEAVDGAGGADVTDRVRELVSLGADSIPATNSTFGDPTPGHVKRLVIQYRAGGQTFRGEVAENAYVDLAAGAASEQELGAAFSARVTPQGMEFVAWGAGEFEAVAMTGKRTRARAPAPLTVSIGGPWAVSFPPNRGAPARITLPKLISWTEHATPGVKYFSGTAEYAVTFAVPPALVAPGRVLMLELGRVKNLAEVWVNERRVGVLWKEPFRAEVTGLVRPGRNVLRVKVTNLWPNRLIGDEQLPPEPGVEWNGIGVAGSLKRWPEWLERGLPRPKTGRVAFTTWRFYGKDSSLLESGLLGPVTLRSAGPVLAK